MHANRSHLGTCPTCVVLSLYRSGPTFPPWGSTHMENTSWRSWRSTIWRTASTWVLSVALLTASCKPTPPPAWNYVYNLIYSSPPQLPVPVWPFRRHCAHCPPPNPTQWGCLCTPVSTITLRKEPVATGSLSFCQILLPLPHLSPRPSELGEGGKGGREWRERKPAPLTVPFPPFFFPFIYLFFW